MKFNEKPTYKEFIDIEGKQFNRWLVLGYIGKPENGSHHLWQCECQCKNKTIKISSSSSLRRGDSKSCGCYRNEKSRERLLKHGKTYSPEYRSYSLAKSRCENVKSPDYEDYGGRGIKFKFSSFEKFYEELGNKPTPKKKYSINRIDNDGHYEKGTANGVMPINKVETQDKTTG